MSSCSIWETLDCLHEDMSLLHHHPSELAIALGFQYSPHLSIDNLFDSPPDDLFYTYPSNSFDEVDELYQCPKLPRIYSTDPHNATNLLFEPNSYTDPIDSADMSCATTCESTPEFDTSWCNGKEKSGGSSVRRCSSAAARERRRRIAERMQELGRLVPGGNRMNSAEMLQAAFNYVKFLQAQVGLLRVVGSTQCKVSLEMEELLARMLVSPALQERLCGHGLCMVSKEMLVGLGEDHEIRSNLSISRELGRLIESIG